MAGRGGLAFVVAALCALAAAPASAEVRAGAAKVDASWHVGASAGQYASDGTFADAHGVDPHHHSTKRVASYGIQSRLTARALVVEGNNGKRIAIVKNDLYIPQDILYRRVAQILEANGTSGITRETLTMAVTHNHSSPHYSSTSWGVWAFQDVFDFRFFEYYAQRMAEAVEKAAANMQAVRVGASVSQFGFAHRNVPGPTVADDGTPAGFPHDYNDRDLFVIRFDDMRGNTVANLVSYSVHPETLDGNDLISADYLGPLERMVDRETGGVTVYTQQAVGTAEPERLTWHPPSSRALFYHHEYSQNEFLARNMADSIVDTYRDVERGTPEDPDRFVPFTADFPVDMRDRWFPGPASHPYPGVSSCRTDAALQGDPRAPIVGLPDCQGPRSNSFGDVPTPNPGLTDDDIEQFGIPVPENYSAPAYTGVEESMSVHLQALRLGDILVTMCACEQWVEQSKNIKTRTDSAPGMHLGYDWTEQCTQDGGAGSTWTCPRPGGGPPLTGLSDESVQRARAQVKNDAAGWDDLSYVPFAESEPADPAQIKGNFTHTDIRDYGGEPYKMTVAMSMTNDYNGYIVSYREYQRGDHYRKALTAWGPHSSDYMATRLVRLGAEMHGGEQVGPVSESPFAKAVDEWPGGAAKVHADIGFNDQRARVIGELASGGIQAYEAQLPDDGGEAEPVEQPRDVERFGAALFTWNGGSNYTDNPRVRVQRLVRGRWQLYNDQTGELPVTLRYPQAGELPAYRANNQRWHWTAHFEAFVSEFDLGDRPRATPPGVYRFAVDGERREGGEVQHYELHSREFSVGPWTGVTAGDFRDEEGGVSFRIGPRHTYNVSEHDGGGQPPIQDEIGPIDYPDSYDSPARFISHDRTAVRDPAARDDPDRVEWFCFTCSWRPWKDQGDAERAVLTYVRPNGRTVRVAAQQQDGGRWFAARELGAGEAAFVDAGDACDEWGNYNGVASERIGDEDVQPRGSAGYSCVPRAGANGTPPGSVRRGERGRANPLGLPSNRRCVDRRRFRFRIHQPRGGRIVAVRAFVNGRRVLARRKAKGRIKVVRVKRLPIGRFKLKIVAIHSNGTKTISTRKYRGCKKSRPKTRVKRREGRRR